MKTLTATLLMLITSNAFGFFQSVELEPGDLSLTPIAGQYEIEYQGPECGLYSPCPQSTVVSIDYELFGCADRLFQFESVKENKDGSYNVTITALNVATEASQYVRCDSAGRTTKKIPVARKIVNPNTIHVNFVGAPTILR